MLKENAHPGADLRATASDEERVKGAVRLVELRRVDDYKHLVQFLHFQLLGRFRDLALLLDDAPQGGLIPLVPVSLSRWSYFLTGIQPSSM